MSSKLTKWCFDTFGGNSNGIIEPKIVLLHLLNDHKEPLFTWTFNDAYPVSWDIGGFDAEKSNVIIESIELTYSFS